MSKTSCITRLPNDTFVMLRTSYIEICNGDRCAAMLLANFEFWHNGKLEGMSIEQTRSRDDRKYVSTLTTWVYRNTDDLMTGLLGMYKRNSVLAAITRLVELGFIRTQTDPKNPFSKTRFFELQPSKVNDALDFHSGLKKDSRQSTFKPSQSLKRDSLPYCLKEEVIEGEHLWKSEPDPVFSLSPPPFENTEKANSTPASRDCKCIGCNGTGKRGIGPGRSKCGDCRGTGKTQTA